MWQAISGSIFCFVPVAIFGQPIEDNDLAFEVASVRLHPAGAFDSTGRSGYEESAGQIRIEDTSLRGLIALSFDVKGDQVAGPGWLDSATFDINAKPPAGYEHAQLQYLVRNLMATRFKLSVHNETKQVSAFSLVVSKGGHKLHESAGPRTYMTGRPGLIEGKMRSVAELTRTLTNLLGQPVVNQTGLTGLYDLKLEWTPVLLVETLADTDVRNGAEPGLSLFTALQEQLGLRLESQKVPGVVIVVDHVERVPTEN